MFVHTRGARRIVSTTPLRWLHRQQRPLRRLLQPSIRTKTSQSKPPPNHKSTSGSSWKTAALGTSGFVLFCGLDFVAPAIISILTDEDPEKEITYWKERNRLSSSTTDSSNKKKSSFQLSRTQNNAATEIKERSQLLSLKKDTVNGGSSNNNNNNIQANVVIVGGGLAGLHTALALSERSPQPIHILLLDAHRIGQGASGKSKGLVVPGIQVPEEDLAESCGSQVLAAKIYKLSYQAMKRLKTDIVQKYKISCDWVDSGLVEATLWVEEEEAGDKDADATEDDDDGCRALSATEVRQMLGQPKTNNLYQGGEFDPSCSGVDPLALTCGIANVLETKFGVQLYEQTKATKVEKYAPKDNHVDTTKSQEQETKVGLNNKYLVTTDTGAQIECQHGKSETLLAIYPWQ